MNVFDGLFPSFLLFRFIRVLCLLLAILYCKYEYLQSQTTPNIRGKVNQEGNIPHSMVLPPQSYSYNRGTLIKRNRETAFVASVSLPNNKYLYYVEIIIALLKHNKKILPPKIVA